MVRVLSCVCLFLAASPSASTSGLERQAVASTPSLEAVIAESLAIDRGEPGTPAFAAAAEAYRAVLETLKQIDRARLGLDDQVDSDLLVAHVRTRLFEMETLRLHEVNPASVFALGQTNGRFLRPGALPDSAVRAAVWEPRRLPAGLERAKQNLKDPARTWTENVIYKRRMGEHYSMKHFHDTLLTYGDLPFKQIRRLTFRD